MPQYQVDSEQIQSAAGAVNNSVTSIRDAVSGMYINLDNLQGVWKGGAATQFGTVAEQWRTSQQRMEEALEGIQSALTQASTLYSDTEDQATRLFSGS